MSLMEQLKKLSKELDIKMEHMKRKNVHQTPEPEKIQSQMECLSKMLKTYEAEKLKLIEYVNAKTGYDKVVEMEIEYGKMMQEQENLQRQIKDLQKQNKLSGKILAKGTERKESGMPLVEVELIMLAIRKKALLSS